MAISRLYVVLYLIAGLAAAFSNAHAADISLHGFLQGNYSADTTSSNPDGGDFKLAEERLQLKLEASKDPFRFFLKMDAFYDHISEEPELEVREGYLDFTSSKWDMRIGRQVITWGVGDLLFINDVFPKNFAAFFSGRPLEYLKIGADGAKVGIYPGFASFEVVAIPFFTPNTYPSPGTFWLLNPVLNGAVTEKVEPAVTLGNTELAIRAYRDIAGFDASLYAYRGFWRQPSMMPDNPVEPTGLTLFYPKLSAYGASLQGRALDGVLSLEAGYYDSREDRNGANPMIPNSQTRFLIGYQRQIWEDFTIGVQYYGEYMHDYSKYVKNIPQGFPLEDELRQLVTVRLTQFLMHQTLKLSFFAFYSPSDGDYMLNPEIKYNFSDHIWAAWGANVFGGDKGWTQFGQMDRNDNVYMQFRYEF